MSIPDHDAHYTLRSDLRAALRSDLLGPQGGPHEVLADDAPITAYLIGVLFPRVGEDVTVTTDDESSVEDAPDVVSGDDPEQGTADLGVALTNRRKPSSMG